MRISAYFLPFWKSLRAVGSGGRHAGATPLRLQGTAPGRSWEKAEADLLANLGGAGVCS
jgi:hypothetical protein